MQITNEASFPVVAHMWRPNVAYPDRDGYVHNTPGASVHWEMGVTIPPGAKADITGTPIGSMEGENVCYHLPGDFTITEEPDDCKKGSFQIGRMKKVILAPVDPDRSKDVPAPSGVVIRHHEDPLSRH